MQVFMSILNNVTLLTLQMNTPDNCPEVFQDWRAMQPACCTVFEMKCILDSDSSCLKFSLEDVQII